MNIKELDTFMKTGSWNKILKELYGESATDEQKKRYTYVLQEYADFFGQEDSEIQVFSSPGRTEIGGNHTDHNLGKVLTGSVDFDCIAIAAPTNDGKITIHDLKYKEDFTISISDTAKQNDEHGAVSLIRGIIKGFEDRGLKAGGFRACIVSNVIAAAGVSSSASFEMLICAMMDDFYNQGTVPKTVYAQIGQFAENAYWDKQSGLLDQSACAIGGLISIDFEKPGEPIIQKINCDFSDYGYRLIIVNTGSGHADLSAEYSSIPIEMKSVAGFFGKATCREINLLQLIENITAIRKQCGDRAVMRALHFFEENDRVDREIKALENKDFEAFLTEVNASGDSSWKWLQNVYVSDAVMEQPIPISLALTELFIREKGIRAACRIHGGGFAGVIMAILPEDRISEYSDYMRRSGKEPYVMNVRRYGAVNVLKSVG